MKKVVAVPAPVILIVIIAAGRLPLPRAAAGGAGAYAVTVEAGPHERRESAVTFTLPAEARSNAYRLLDDAGRVVPLQVEGELASLVLDAVSAGGRRVYRLEPATRAGVETAVEASRERDRVSFRVGGRTVLGYQAEPTLPRPDIKPIFRRGGYIHQVLTPGGRLVTDDFPPNHVHHHGIWAAWTKTEFEGRHPDFWNMGDGTGTVEFVALDRSWSGPVHGGLRARHRYVDLSAPEPRAALSEVWELTVYRGGSRPRPYWVFDLVSRQETAGQSPLVLPEYHYGGLGFRGHRQWDGKDNTTFLTSEGKDRSNGHGTRARWCHIGGRVDGQPAGLAILDHPDNYRAPQPMRIHPTEPFFCYAPSQLGRWEIAPGRAYVSRHRFIVQDGTPDGAELDRLWNDFAHPPRVTVAAAGTGNGGVIR